MRKKCMIGPCEKRKGDLSKGGKEIKFTRGCCQTCYNMLRVMISQNQATWEDLIEAGVCLGSKEEIASFARDYALKKLAAMKKSKNATNREKRHTA